MAVRWASLFSSPFFHPSVARRPRGARAARAALRPRVPRERGLRPLDAAARACRRRQPGRAARALSRAPRPGLAGAQWAAAGVSGARVAARDRAGGARSCQPSGQSSRGGSARAFRSTKGGSRMRPRPSSSSCAPSSSPCNTLLQGRSPAREAAGRALARLAFRASGRARGTLLRQAAMLDPLLSTHAAIRRTRRLVAARCARVEAAGWLSELRARRHDCTSGAGSDPRAIRVAAVFPEPTPYRAPLLDRVAAQPEVDLTVIYAAETVAGRTWRIDPRHRAVFLRGARVPGAREILHHDYPVTPGVTRALAAARPEVVVVSGWSTFAAQAAIVWSRCPSRAVRPGRREPRRGPSPGLAAPGEGCGRAARGRGRLRRARHRNARATLDGRPRRSARAGARLREHDRRRGVRGAGRPAGEPPTRAAGASSVRGRTTSSCSRSPGSCRRRVSMS